ncbi:unnamed protein product [Rotaria socialis]|uniref:Mutator-like transposase domain-containing protein n=3 Tax=Rotaria socialis TaxID=392032 RepID=A0A821LUM7_9BILA|nr:unnamed protein product [Rotaria socialis]CAF4756777.1 unnamed protein product [Rotaria socialis]
MTRSSALKKEKQLRLARNTSKSRKIINIVRKNTRELQTYFISNKSQSISNEQFTYKTRTFTGPSCQKLTAFLKQKGTDDNNNIHEYYQIIHNSFLLQLMKKTVCASCKLIWNGDMSVAKREGTIFTSFSLAKMNNYIYITELYCSLLFTCCCSHEIKINTSKQCPNTSKRDINVRSVIGANFPGIGHQGLAKLCAILNVPLPIDEDHFSDTLDYLLPTFESYRLRSMKNAVEEACKKSNGRKITVSGDASMEVAGIHRLFARSKMLCNVKYAHYIGDGDAKVFLKLISDPPYEDVSITKIEDVNHFSKKMLHRLQKIAESLKKTNIDGKLGIRGSGRMTKKMMINFKHYYRLAIVRNKTNLDDMVRAVWAIWKHKSSLNSEPHHEWCSPSYCGYLQALEKGEEYDHTPHSLPLKIMQAIRPVFEELAHPDNLKTVLNGGSQNANESFHSILWSLALKNRYSTGVMIDLCVAMAVSFYNDGYQSIIPVLAELTGNPGFFTRVGMKRLNERRIYYEHKRKRKAVQKSKQNEETSDSLSDRMSVDDNRDDQLDDSYIPGAY